MRAASLLETDPAAAARRASDILAGSPAHSEAGLLLGAALRRFEVPAAAATVLESLVAARPDSPLLHLELGRAYVAGSRGAEALAALRRAVQLDAALADAWRALAAQLFAAVEALAGDQAYAPYARLWPGPPELEHAIQALPDNRLLSVGALLTGRLQLVPHDCVALLMLAKL